MIEALKRNWWVLVIRGICGIVFGVIAFAYPGLALATLVILFGAWVLIDGVFRIVGATAGRASDPDWGFHLIIGLLGVVVGFLTFRAPRIDYLRRVTSMESGAGRSRSTLAHRFLRDRAWYFGDLFWLPIAQPAYAASVLIRNVHRPRGIA